MSETPSEEDIGQHGCRGFPLRPGLATALRVMALILATTVMVVTTSLMPASVHVVGPQPILSVVGLMVGIAALYVLLARIQAGAVKVDWFGFAFTGLLWDSHYRWSEVEAIGSGDSTEITLIGGRSIVNRGWLMTPGQRQLAWRHLEKRLTAWQRRPEMALPGGGFSMAGQRLTLRPWAADEWPIFHRIYSDASLIRWQLYERMPAWRTRRKFAFHRNCVDVPRVYGWSMAVVVRSDGSTETDTEKVVGHLDVWVSSVSGRRLSCGYGVFEEARGRGYATEALTLISEEALSHWAVEGIDATCFEENLASQKVLERAGFFKRAGASITVRKRLKKARLYRYERSL